MMGWEVGDVVGLRGRSTLGQAQDRLRVSGGITLTSTLSLKGEGA